MSERAINRGGVAGAAGAFGRLIARLFKGRDKGTVAVTFLLSLLVFVPVTGVIVQWALLANAMEVVNRAASAAARSAMVVLPTDPAVDTTYGQAPADRAAWMVLESISPQAQASQAGQQQVLSPDDGQTVADALSAAGYTVLPSYPARYAFAQQSGTITIQPQGAAANASGGQPLYAELQAPQVQITITYQFRLTVPMFNMLLGQPMTVAGVSGRYMTLTATRTVQLSDGREAGSTVNQPFQP